MKDPSESTVCDESDFDTEVSAKKICFNNGLELEVINYQTLRINTNSFDQIGTYEAYIWY